MCVTTDIYDQCAQCFRLEILLSYGPLCCDYANYNWSPPCSLTCGQCPDGVTITNIIYSTNNMCQGCGTLELDSSLTPQLADNSPTQEDTNQANKKQLAPLGDGRSQVCANTDKAEPEDDEDRGSSDIPCPDDDDECKDWLESSCLEPDSGLCLCHYMF